MQSVLLSTLFITLVISANAQIPTRPPSGNIVPNINLNLPNPSQAGDFKLSGNLLRGGAGVNGGSLTGHWNPSMTGGNSFSGTLGWQNGKGFSGGFQGSLGIRRGFSFTGGLSGGGGGGPSGNFGLRILFPHETPKVRFQ